MSKVICCYVNLFDRNVTVFDMEEKNPEDTHTLGVIDLNELPTSLYKLCTAVDTNKVHLFGNETYLLGLTDTIAQVAKPKNYKFSTLELEIN